MHIAILFVNIQQCASPFLCQHFSNAHCLFVLTFSHSASPYLLIHYMSFFVNLLPTLHRQLFSFLEQAYGTVGPSPQLHTLDTIWDWKSLLTNHMHGLTGHSSPHVFHFFCSASGQPVIQDKAYHTQGTWSEPYQLLTSIPTGTLPFLFSYFMLSHLSLSQF
jgi:hypothetical protein